jgi:hypothetical protein
MNNRIFFPCLAMIIAILLTGCSSGRPAPAAGEEWIRLFNGKDLSGWDIKIAGRPLNENYKNTFRVEDGALRVAYDQYQRFENKFGHIYHQIPYSYYKLRFQYRFIGSHVADAPVWADRNSGIMVHSQSAKSLNMDQEFPVSLEMQLLTGIGDTPTPTGNICTPGTQVHINGSLNRNHCINSTSRTYKGEAWVSGEIQVFGDSLVRHIIEGDTVLTYTKPTIGGGFLGNNVSWASAHITDSAFWIARADSPLKEGYIALQAESQPVDFRNLELLDLVGCMDVKASNYKDYYVKPENSRCKY